MSGEQQELVDSGMKILAQMYARYGDLYKSKGKTDEANDYFQRAVNIADPDTFDEYTKKQGIDLSGFTATVDTINNDAFARCQAENYAVAAWLWKKTADKEK